MTDGQNRAGQAFSCPGTPASYPTAPTPLQPWPERPSPLRQRLTDYTRAYRVAQRMFERSGRPVAILEQDCSIQSHCVVWGDEVFCLELEGQGPKPYRLVTTVF